MCPKLGSLHLFGNCLFLLQTPLIGYTYQVMHSVHSVYLNHL